MGGKGIAAVFRVDNPLSTFIRIFSRNLNPDLRNSTKNQFRGVFTLPLPPLATLTPYYVWVGEERWYYNADLNTLTRRDVNISSVPTVFHFMAQNAFGYTMWFTSATDLIMKASNFENPDLVLSIPLSTALAGSFPIARVLGLSAQINVYFVLVQ